jgi:hypothetical protein
MEFLQPSMDASRRLQIIYFTGCGSLTLYVSLEMMQPTVGLVRMLCRQKHKQRQGGAWSVCRHDLAGVCHMQERCQELHTVPKVSRSLTQAFEVDCFCGHCFKVDGTMRSLLQCMFCSTGIVLPLILFPSLPFSSLLFSSLLFSSLLP